MMTMLRIRLVAQIVCLSGVAIVGGVIGWGRTNGWGPRTAFVLLVIVGISGIIASIAYLRLPTDHRRTRPR
jgi:hypothetical protein